VFCDIKDINTFITFVVQSTSALSLVEEPKFNLGERYEYRLATYELGKLEFNEKISSYVDDYFAGITLNLSM
jgi:hypothetical protein